MGRNSKSGNAENRTLWLARIKSKSPLGRIVGSDKSARAMGMMIFGPIQLHMEGAGISICRCATISPPYVAIRSFNQHFTALRCAPEATFLHRAQSAAPIDISATRRSFSFSIGRNSASRSTFPPTSGARSISPSAEIRRIGRHFPRRPTRAPDFPDAEIRLSFDISVARRIAIDSPAG